MHLQVNPSPTKRARMLTEEHTIADQMAPGHMLSSIGMPLQARPYQETDLRSLSHTMPYSMAPALLPIYMQDEDPLGGKHI